MPPLGAIVAFMKETASKHNVTVGQLVGALFLFFGLSAVAGALLAATAIPLAAASGATTNALTGLFEDLPTDIDFTQPSQQSTLVAADGTVIAKFYAENRIVVASDEISQYLKDAAVSVEDERFYQHNGVDAQGIMGALVNNVTGGDLAGGSTITQQYVKNALIEEGRVAGDEEKIAAATQTSLARKLNEARYAISLENHKSKDEILTGYLNIAQFGPSEYGVESASRYYFGVPAKDVTIAQAATLAATTQAPNKWDPESNPEGAQQRRDLVLSKMLELGYITQEQHDEAVATSVADTLNITPSANGCDAAGNAAYFCSTVIADALNSQALGKTAKERSNTLYRGGITIVSTMNPKHQDAAYNAILNKIDVNDASGAQMALASVEPGTGKVLAMAQNTEFGDPTEDDPTRTKINLSVGQDQAGGNGFQSGSTFKMFTLVTWIANEHSTYERVNGSKRAFPAASWTNTCFPNQVSFYNPGNSGGGGGGMMTVRQATANSVNVAFTEMANKLDLCEIWKTANAMGVRRGALTTKEDLKDPYVKATGVKVGDPMPLTSTPSMILGVNSVTPLSTANAYATLAAEGKMCTPITFTEVKDANGQVIATQNSECKQVIDADVARLTTNVLEGVTASQLPNRQSAGKTGTTDENKDVWFAGFTPQLATAVWLGHKDGLSSLNGLTFKGVRYGSVYGVTIPAPVFRDYMTTALDGEPALDFTKSALRDRPPQIQVPNVAGLNYQDAAQKLRSAGFSVSTQATLDGPQDQTVISTSPAAESLADPGSTVTLIVSMPPAEPESPPDSESTSPADRARQHQQD